MRKVLVTGGAGFIGANFVNHICDKDFVFVVDKLTYAGDKSRLRESQNIKFFEADICDTVKMSDIFAIAEPDIVVHFASETHVDNSINCNSDFMNTNLKGTEVLLSLSKDLKPRKFVHISTDEVYGSHEKGFFKETDPIAPRNPYSATKAGAEHLCQAYYETFNVPITIVRPCNNFGQFQNTEKFIPKVITSCLTNKPFPIYGKGHQIREWIHVNDCVRAIKTVMEKGEVGEVYNIGSGYETNNLSLATAILWLTGAKKSLMTFTDDRLGHDFRYSVDFDKIKELGWSPDIDFDTGLKLTIAWYSEQMIQNK